MRLFQTCRPSLAVFAIALAMNMGRAASAATPDLGRILPRGVQRGTEADLRLQGQRLDDAKELLIYSPGVTVTALDATNPAELHAHIKIDQNAHIGEYQVRVRTETGISELKTFFVSPFPVVEVKEQKDAKGRPMPGDFEHPQPVDMNVTVAGELGNEQVQYFAVEAKKGQHITAEVQGMRLGTLFDPYVAILDEKKFELAVSDDTALAMQDPIASAIVPADGKYIVLIRESSYGQGSHFLLHIGTFPRPTITYPLGGRPNEDLHVRYIGDAGGAFDGTIKLPGHEIESFDSLPEQNGQVAPSPIHLRVSDMPNVLEKEPNDDQKSATAYDGDLPVAMNGIIDRPGDVDYFRFKAKSGQQLDIRVLARRLRSPLDSVLTVCNAQGNQLAQNDDAGGPDSYLRFGVPADGEYVIGITDQLSQGGLDYVYRVEITIPKPDLTFTIPTYEQNSQQRWTVPVPRGNRYATLMRATRVNFGGDVSLAVNGLPDGVSMQSPNPGESDVVPVVFEARPDAPIGGKLCELSGKSLDEKAKVDVNGHYEQHVDLVIGNNNAPLYRTTLDTLSVAVTKEAPFKLHLEQPKVPLVQGGEMNLKVTAERAKDFNQPISIRLLFTPPNINGQSAMDMPGDKSEIQYPISAQQNAAPHTWKICVVGMSDVKGQLWVSSELVDLTVADPFLLAKLQMSAGEQGKPASVLCKLEQKRPFEGKAKAKLLGLPPNATADEVDITSADQQAVFNVNISDKTPAGNHQSLFVRVTVMKDGQEIVHNVAQGGVLRVDKPEPPKANAPPPPVAVAKPEPPKPPPAGQPVRVLSRLEKLREEQGKP